LEQQMKVTLLPTARTTAATVISAYQADRLAREAVRQQRFEMTYRNRNQYFAAGNTSAVGCADLDKPMPAATYQPAATNAGAMVLSLSAASVSITLLASLTINEGLL
jgi:hypothetical protein